MATAFGYDAFISYSHRHDDALGPALQTSLERFAKPWYKLRALRTFIDKANLAASPELWASVEDGLKSSRWFVLLASADAALSPWVDREVRWWLDHRSADRLLIVATSPGMAWEKRKEDWAADAPVPPALRGAFTSEPLWIDLSNIQLDSRKPQIPADLIANVAAPIRDVPKDALVGQHLREHRRAMRLAGSAVTVLAVLTVLAVVAGFLAIGQRDDAIGQPNKVIYNNILTEALQLRTTNPSLAAQLNLTAYRMHQNQTVRSRLLSTENLLLANPVLGSGATVGALALSADGRIMATGGYDGVIRLWNAAGSAPWATIGQARTGAIDEIFSVAFSPDSHILAAGDAQGRVRLWKVVSPAPPLYLGQVRASAVFSVAFSPDGRLLAAGSEDGVTRLWNVTDPAHPTAAGHLGTASGGLVAVYSVAFSPDSRTLAVGSEPGAIQLWNVARLGHPVPLSQLLRGGSGAVRSVAFSPTDSHTLVIVGDDGLLRLWDVSAPARPDEVATAPVGNSSPVNSVSFSPTGAFVATGSSDGTVVLWNVLKRGELTVLSQPQAGDTSDVYAVAFSPSGDLATASADGIVRRWDVPGNIMITPGGPVDSVALTRDHRTLATGSADGSVTLWNVTDPASPEPVSGSVQFNPNPVDALGFSPDGRMMTSIDDIGDVALWDVTDRTRPAFRTIQQPGDEIPVSSAGNTEPHGSAVFSPDGRLIATGSESGFIQLWGVKSPFKLTQGSQARSAGAGTFSAVAFSPDSRTLAGGSDNGTIQLWNIADPAHPVVISRLQAANADAVRSLSFSPDGRTLVSGDQSGTIQLWKLTSQALPAGHSQVQAGNGSPVYPMVFSPDNRTLAVGGADGSIQLWDVRDPAHPAALGQPISASTNDISSMTFSSDGHTLVSGDNSGIAWLWDLNVDHAISRICATTRNDLTAQQWHKYVPQLPYNPPCGR